MGKEVGGGVWRQKEGGRRERKVGGGRREQGAGSREQGVGRREVRGNHLFFSL